MDMKFGPDGSLYVLAYGNGWGTNNDDTGLYRVDYAAANRAPVIKASADKDSGGAPLTVNFDASRLVRSRPGRHAHLRVGLHQRRHDRRHDAPRRATSTRRRAR